MTILATGARPDATESGGVRPLIRVAREALDVSMLASAKGGASGGKKGRAEDLERSLQLSRAIGLRIDVFNDAKLRPLRDEALKVA